MKPAPKILSGKVCNHFSVHKLIDLDLNDVLQLSYQSESDKNQKGTKVLEGQRTHVTQCIKEPYKSVMEYVLNVVSDACKYFCRT